MLYQSPDSYWNEELFIKCLQILVDQIHMAPSFLKKTTLMFLLGIFALLGSVKVYAQAQDAEKKEGGLPSRFAMERKEAGFFCGPFLPNQIPGISELMPLCGARVGLKVNENTWMEPSFLSGSGHAQQYRIASLGFRTDMAYDDIIASLYAGPSIHFATQPLVDAAGNSIGDQTNIYIGGHLGGSLWAKINDVFYFRSDMSFYLSPGTSLYIGFGVVFRFDPGGSGESGGSSGGGK